MKARVQDQPTKRSRIISLLAMLALVAGYVSPSGMLRQGSTTEPAAVVSCAGDGSTPVPVANTTPLDMGSLLPAFQSLIDPRILAALGITKTLTYDAATLEITAAALAAATSIGITPLAETQLPKLDGGMTNVTQGPRRGYRFTPHPFRFQQKIRVTLPYDPALLGQEFTAQDIYSYYFDDQTRCWRALERVAVDESKHVIVSLTDHFTDMVNATVVVPDHPEGASFNPNQLKDIQAADPGARVNLIGPPSPNNKGDNRLDYPIEVPPGRHGLQPQLGVAYNSSSGNGWMGVGWDLPTQAIMVDTRWGVPRYATGDETETYLLNGEQLAPVAHRGTPQARTADKIFHTRVESGFFQIVRRGDDPRNYSWEITDKSGTTYFYGGPPADAAEATTLTDRDGNIFLWTLREIRDANGNFVRYHSVRQGDNGIDGGTEPGSNVYLDRITYTGFGGSEGTYAVNFTRDRELGQPLRVDKTIDARGGFKRVTADLLKKVEVSRDGALIRRYEFDYTTGAFFKTLLRSIAQFGADGALFNTHNFDYFDDIRDGNGNYQAFQSVQWTSPGDGVGNGALNLTPENAGDASAISGNSSIGGGGHLYVGVGTSPTKSNSVGLKVGFSHDDSQGLLALADVDGDNLPDKVFKDGGGVKYRKNLGGPGGLPRFDESARSLNLPGVQAENSDTLTIGIEGYLSAVAAQLDYVNTFTSTDRYFSDVNGDGIADLVNGGTVLFGRVGPDGVPVYGVSGDTPVPIGSGTVNASGLFGDFAQDRERLIDSMPLLDSVRRWVAPFDGTVQMTGAVKLADETAAARATSSLADGVRVAVQLEDTELWSDTIGAQDNTEHSPSGVDSIAVTRGQRLYFRVGSVFDGSLDQVSWNPTVSYVGAPSTLDVNGLRHFTYEAARDFTLGGRTAQVKVPLTGILHLDGALTKSGTTTDDVTVLITRDGAPVFEQTLGGGATGQIPMSLDVPVQAGQTMRWRVKVDSPIDLDVLDWTPTAHYTAADGIDRITDNAGNPLVKVDPPFDIDMYPSDDLTAPQGFYDVPQDGQLTVTPALSFNFGAEQPNTQVAFTVKRRGELVAKRFFQITNGQVSTPDPFTVPVNGTDELFFDFSAIDPKLRQFLTGRSVSVSLDGGGAATVPSVFHSSAEEGAFPQPYRGWGAIGYNGNRDRATQPITQNDLIVDENFGDQLPDSVDPPAQRPGFEADPRVTPTKVVPFAPTPETKRWGAGGNAFVAKDSSASSRMGGQSVRLPRPSDFAGATAVPRLSRSEQVSLTGSVGGGVGTVGGSVAFGKSTSQVDFLDMNGDQFPDVVGAGNVQYTDPNGALGARTGAIPDGGVRRSTNVSGNASAGSAARTISTGRGQAAPPARTSANTSQSGNDMPPLGVGGNLGAGTSNASFDLLDVNGDDLPDRVYEDGQVALNLGYRFGDKEGWRGPAKLNDGSSSNFGLNIGFNTDFYGFAGGASYGEGTSSTAASLLDMNGDGLADRVFSGSPITVALNTGNGFEAPVPFNGSLSGVNNDQNAKLGGGVYFTFGICFIAICIVINPGGDISTGASRTEQMLRDINGDGFADHLKSTSDNQLEVRQNKTDRTNLIRTVHRPMGARMDFDYTRDGNNYGQPNSKWLLSRVSVLDGQPGDGPDRQLATYRYSGGKFDRLEREFNGYHTVVEEHRDTGNADALYRSISRDYATDSFYTRGLLQREITTDAAGGPFLEMVHSYSLRDVLTGATPADATSTTATIFPRLVRTDRRFYEGQANPGKATFTEHEYDGFGNVTRTFDAADTGAADDVLTTVRYTAEDAACLAPDNYIIGTAKQIDVVGNGSTMRHREATVDCATGNVTQVRTQLASGDTAVTDVEYFDNGNLKSVLGPPNQTGQRYKLEYTYDPAVQTYVESVTDSFGYRSSATYNLAFGEPESTTDFNNQVVRNTYDAVGRVDTITGPYEAPENRITIDFEYHPEASVPYAVTRHVDRQADNTVRPDTIDTITFTDGIKRVLQTKKDAALSTGPDTPVLDGMTVSGRVVFDFLGRPVQRFYPVTEGKSPANTTFNTAFDSVLPTRLGYDVLDRNVRTQLPDDTVTTMAYGFGPDRAGATQFETITTDANGKAKRAYTDVRNLTTAVKEFNPAGGQPVIWTSYGYNPLGEPTGVVDDHGNATTATYDNFGRRTSVTSPDSGRTEQVYDLADNIIKKITAKLSAEQKAIEYDYEFNRLARIRYPVFPQNNVTYTYGAPNAADNAADRVTHIVDGAGTVDRKYGPLGEVTEETRTTTAQGSHVFSFTTRYTFDTWNRMLRMTFPDGEVLSYSYNSGGQVSTATGVKGEFTYPYLRRLDYDKFEQRVLLDTGNGTRTRYTYDAADRRLANIQSNLAQGYVFQNLNYTYDNVGNVTSVTNDTVAPSGPDVGRQVGGPSQQTFGYDDLYQLTHAEGVYQPRTPRENRYRVDFSYDSIHNLTSKNQVHELVSNGNAIVQGKTSYTYGYTYGGAKPHAPSQLGPFTIDYDANGNQISRSQQPQPRRQLIWDEENRMACSHENVQSHTLPQTPESCDDPGGTPNNARYKYDDQGNRVVKDSSQFHIYPNQNFTQRGNQAFKHVYIGSTRLITKFVEPEHRIEDRQFYNHSDQLGSMGFVTNDQGDLAEHMQYFAGGETWVSEHPSQPIPYQYSGKELDPETGLYYYGARYYDPRTGIWQSPDPLSSSYLDGAPNGGVFNSFNLATYTYSSNNPMTFTDPTGLVSWGDFAWGVAKGAAVGLVAGVAVGALIASGGTLAPAIGYAIVAYGVVQTGVAATEVATGRTLDGRQLTEAERSDMAGQLVGGVVAGGAGGRLGARMVRGPAPSTAAPTPPPEVAPAEVAPTTPAAPTPAAAPAPGAAPGTPAPQFVTARPGFTPKANRGGAPGSRPGEDFTPAGRDEVLQRNAASQPDRIARCALCGEKLTKPAKSQRGVTPPRTDAQVDHTNPKSNGGSGDPSNGQGLCRVCNRDKSDNVP